MRESGHILCLDLHFEETMSVWICDLKKMKIRTHLRKSRQTETVGPSMTHFLTLTTPHKFPPQGAHVGAGVDGIGPPPDAGTAHLHPPPISGMKVYEL